MAPVDTIASDLVDFLNASPTNFHAVAEAKGRLQQAGFTQLSEREDWALELEKKYFFTRNHSTILAFAIGKKYSAGNGFYIIGAHTDSPCLKVKPVSKERIRGFLLDWLSSTSGVAKQKDILSFNLSYHGRSILAKVTKGGYLEVGVQTYGGGLWHTWFDRDLTLAGRVIVKETKDGSESYSHKLIRIQDPIMRIPTLAIHLDRNVNTDGFKFNTQTHLHPVLATSIKGEIQKIEDEDTKEKSGERKNANSKKHHPVLLQMISSQASCKPDEICDFELQICDTQPSLIGGAQKEFIFSGRLDNLCMSFCSLKALIDSTSAESSLIEESGVRMVALFDHEEVGSDSAQGAGSPILIDAISRIIKSFTSSDSKLLEKSIQKSYLVSADMAHALHPNHMDKHEDNHQPKLHGGLVIKHNANQRYATNAVTSFIFREIAEKHNLPVQDFVVRNDMACGSTIGPILSSGIGIRTVDVGAPQLSMHSIREMCAVDDVKHSYEHFQAFFKEVAELDEKLVVDF